MGDDPKWNTLAVRLILGLTALRLLWHLVEPIGLLGDEAYYWEWGRRLDWGYFSKPPLIAWLYGIVGRLTGDSLYAFKATATLLTGGGLWFLYLAMRRAFDPRLAFWALAASALSVGNTVLASILTIDAPLLFFWCLALWLYFDLLFAGQKLCWGMTLALAVALGFGHLSKQMMLTFLPLMFAGAWFVNRVLLRKPHLYAAALLSLLFLLPPFLWNMDHHWVTVTHTEHHFQAENFDLGEIAARYAGLFGITAVLLTPILVVLMLGAIWSARRWSDLPSVIRMLFCFGPAALLGIGLLALRQDINPNWPAVFYPTAIAMTTWWCFRPDTPQRAAWFRRSVALGAAFTIGLMGLLPFLDKLGIPAQRRGWQGYKDLPYAIANKLSAAGLESENELGGVIVNGHRFTCSQLSYHIRKPLIGDTGTVPVFLWPNPAEVSSQYDFWPGPRPGTDALLVVERKSKGRAGEPYDDLAAAFDEIIYIGEVPLHHSRDFPTFKIYFARNLKYWPTALTPKESK